MPAGPCVSLLKGTFMSTVLAYTSPAIGDLYPMVPVLLELRSRGHDIHVLTLESQVEALTSQGLHTRAIDPAVRAIRHNDWSAKNTVQSLKAAVHTFTARAAIEGPDLERAITELEPDLVIVDLNAWGGSLAAESWGGPWVFVSAYTPPIRSRGTPPFGPGMLPMAGPLGRLRDGVVRPLVIGAAERLMRPAINELRTPRGLAPVHSADEFFRRADLMLVATSEPFEYPHPDWGDGIRMVGALPWEPPAEVPAWLDELDGPLVLLTTSSEYQADEALVRTAAEGLGNEPFTVVATMPAGLSDVGPLPDNMRVVDFVPHGAVLERAVAAVTHGGMGVTQKALSHGVPVCVVPFGRDQLEVAARVVHSDSGTKLPKKLLTPAALRDAVRGAMTKQVGAARVAAGYRAAGGAVAGADAVEQLLPVSAEPSDA